MKVVLLALGSRGDVQPMVALGKGLKAMGKPVVVVALREFAPLVETAGLSFLPIDSTLEASGPAAEEAARTMARGGSSYQRAVNQRLAEIAPKVVAAEMAAVEPGDVVVAGVLSIDDAVALQEALGCLAVHVLTAPVLLLTPPPGDWPDNICQTGIWFDESPTWHPPADLTKFLAGGEPPVFLGFGSMPSANPSADVTIMTQAVCRAGRRAVIRPSHGWGEPEHPPQDVYLLREAPYRWLFPQMAAIIHRGGAGTTAEALLAGVPNAVVAFGVDQPYHGRRIHHLGAGPSPIKRSKLNGDRLAALITALTEPAQAARWRVGATRARSQSLRERGLEVAVERLTALMTDGDRTGTFR